MDTYIYRPTKKKKGGGGAIHLLTQAGRQCLCMSLSLPYPHPYFPPLPPVFKYLLHVLFLPRSHLSPSHPSPPYRIPCPGRCLHSHRTLHHNPHLRRHLPHLCPDRHPWILLVLFTIAIAITIIIIRIKTNIIFLIIIIIIIIIIIFKQ